MINKKIRDDFPILKRKINGKPLVYLDSAATSQKPVQMLNAIREFYEKHNSNVHRGVHRLSQEATDLYDSARNKIAKFIGAEFEEIIFTKNTTEAVNVVLYGWASRLKKGDEIISTVMEHHSNIVPWQSLQKRGIKLKFVDIKKDGTLDMEQYKKLVTKNTKLVTVTHVSNVLGTVNPVKDMGKIAHENGALFMVDGAQSVPHMPVDVKKIDCDFLVFSGHKMLAPTGTGCLYGRVLEEMDFFMLGSDMIKEVSLYETKFRESPWKFEPGTPDFEGAIALGAAVDYLSKIGMENVHQHEKELIMYAMKRLAQLRKIAIYGPSAEKRGGVISFNLGDIHSHDLASMLDEEGIAIRSGHHCAQPLMNRLKVPATSRASFYLYNTKEEIDILIEALEKAAKVFRL